MSDVTKKPYSYHTFIFPFLWNNSGTVTRQHFEKCMHTGWVPDERGNVPMDRGEYARYCYFNQAARNAIFTEKGEENPVVRNYRFDFGKLSGEENWLDSPKGESNPVRYVLRKDIYKYDPESGEEKLLHPFTASLRINGIRLRLFSTGVGMVVFELENYEYRSEQYITQINELGRRVFMPFVDKYGRCKLCADSITLEYPGGTVAGYISGAKLDGNSDIRVMEPVLFLLRSKTYSATTNPRHAETQFYIEPIIDDRMFVACVWMNDTFAKDMAQEVDGQYRYLADALTKTPVAESNAARRLYELMFVDGDGLSCQSKPMLHGLLEKHIYHRWLEYGTITGITEYSMVTATSFQPNATTFLTMYVEMAMLVLAQRASLLAFERQISDCARGKLRIDDIQREYVLFQSKLLLREVTPQQQGIELYDMLLENLFIDKEKSDLESQINALFALEHSMSENADNWLLFLLATFGVFDAVGFLTAENDLVTVLSALGGIGVLIGLFFFNRRKQMK